MLDPVTSNPSSAARGTTTASSGALVLGKDDFLKLLITQLRHQDPLNPLDQNQFIAQTTQFAALEELQGIGRRIDALQTTSTNASLTQAAGLLGKTAKIASGQVVFDGFSPVDVPLVLEGVGRVVVDVLDGQGRPLRTLAAEPPAPGASAVTWEGKDDAGRALIAGTYGYRVRASGDALAYVTQGVINGLQNQNGLIGFRVGDRFVTTDDIVDLG
jgi:flagellar basal-body rod modification protein FlgD